MIMILREAAQMHHRQRARRAGTRPTKSRSDEASMLLATTRDEAEIARRERWRRSRSWCPRSRRTRAAARRLRRGVRRQPLRGRAAARRRARARSARRAPAAPRRRCVNAGMTRLGRTARRASRKRRSTGGSTAAAAGCGACRYRRRSSDTCSLRERPVCRRRPASPMRSTSWRSTNECTSSSAPDDPGRVGLPPGEDVGERGANRGRVLGRQRAGVASASAQARLPMTSTSNSRRSKRNEAPKSKTAALGSLSNRPDQSVDI